MHINRLASVAIIAATSFTAITIQEGQAQSAGGSEAEIALLKQQLRLLEQKLDKIQKQTSANTAAAANAKAEAKAEARPRSPVPTRPIPARARLRRPASS